MFDTMTGVVGLAMYEDRLAQAKRNMHLDEVVRAGNRHGGRNRFGREAIAQGLIAAAARLAPNTVQTGRAATTS